MVTANELYVVILFPVFPTIIQKLPRALKKLVSGDNTLQWGVGFN